VIILSNSLEERMVIARQVPGGGGDSIGGEKTTDWCGVVASACEDLMKIERGAERRKAPLRDRLVTW
jgi:hypothetical protein